MEQPRPLSERAEGHSRRRSSSMSSNMDRYSTNAILISPFELTVDSGTYSCMGSGLLKEGHKFDPDFDRFLPPVKPLPTRAEAVHEQPLAYWRAQCAFRNLIYKDTMEDLEIEHLQERLRRGKVGMDFDLAKREKELNEKFWKKNADVSKAMWGSLLHDESRAVANPERFLREKFQNAAHSNVVLRNLCKEDRLQVYKAALPLSLFVEFVEAPLDSRGRRSYDKLTVIGRGEFSVREQTQKLSRKAIRTRQRLLDAKEEERRSLHETVLTQVTKIKATESSQGDVLWDVCGLWAIRCPSIEETLDALDKNYSLDIQFAKRTSCQGKLWARFNFVSIKGVFWFMRQAYDGDGDSEEDSDEESNDWDDEEYESFDFPSGDGPSHERPKWNYRWRGEETSDGKVSYSMGSQGSILFSGVGGTKLNGILSFNDNRANIGFSGLKIGCSPQYPSSDYQVSEFEWKTFGKR